MAKQQRGLGKGIGALLGGDNDFAPFRQPVGYVNKEVVGQRESQDTADILRIPVDMIEPNPFQPRMSFDQDALEELADSIKTLGLIQPITVRRREGNRYQIISGERRFRACRLAGMDMIPAYIRDANDQGMLEMAIVENIQRENLDPIEVAMSYQRLIEECNLTQEQMAVRVGKKRASVTNYLRLLKLPAKLQHDLKVGLLSVGHAKVLLGVEDLKLQEYLCDLVIKEDLSVRQLEEKLKKLTEQKPEQQNEIQELPDEYFKVLEIVGKYFENNISLKRSNNGKGSMTIHFGSDEEVRKFLKALEDSNF
ncbi:MAG: ParB/RepB/Spo0J family partition protein [Bacteroidales bacterium]|jgi:ParB family chromosome partitioning protein|nr:ParB/RepB/Spo0J family partition protein [Bacteroidales bacterium]